MRGLWLSALLLSLVGDRCVADPRPAMLAVTSSSAFVAAEELFHETTGCGSVVWEPRDTGDHWSFPVKFGFGGELDPNPILVDKKTGVATWATRDKVDRERHVIYPEF